MLYFDKDNKPYPYQNRDFSNLFPLQFELKKKVYNKCM